MSYVSIVVVGFLVGLTLLLPASRTRAICMLVTLLLAPVVLVAQMWKSPPLQHLFAHPLLPIAIGVSVVVAVAALVVLFQHKPRLIPIFVIVALPFRIPLVLGSTTTNLLVALYLVIASAVVATAVQEFAMRRRGLSWRSGSWLERLLCATVILYALQALYSPDMAKALQQMAFFYAPFALLFIVLRSITFDRLLLKRCCITFVVLGLAFVVFGLWQYQARELLLNPKVIAANSFQGYFRVNSLFFDPNMYGRFVALVLIVVAVVVARAKTWRLLAGGSIALAVLWAGLFVSFSQSSFAALLVGLIALAAWQLKPKFVVSIAALSAVGAVLVVVFFGSTLHLKGSAAGLNTATSGRVALVTGGLDLARKRPILGWGSGGFAHSYRAHVHSSLTGVASASHTIPVTVLSEQGIVGFLLYCGLLGCALAVLIRGARGKPARLAIGAAFIALVVHTWSYAAFLEDPTTWVLLAIGASLAGMRAEPAGVPARLRPRPDVDAGKVALPLPV